MKVKLLAASAALILVSDFAFALDPVRIEQRCEDDSINTTQGVGRNDWALQCKYISARTYDYNINDDWGNRRSRVYYPSFYKPGNFDSWYRAPVVKGATCNRGAYTAMITCLSSCYTPDQKLLFAEGELAIYDAFSRRVSRIVTLDDDANLDNISYTVRNVDAYSESVRDVVHRILEIKTQNGGSLKVTLNHPLILSSGHMKNAEDIQVGDALIAENGEFDEITSIEEVEFFGKVYNVRPDSDSENGVILNGQIVVAQGFLSGSMYYQNTGANHVNRLLLRDSLPNDLI
ncbi:cell surface protein [Pseudoalteromonas luteoviolacea]|uniref:Cell surface protein n=1 Tax=Pseudoalteromonas luteoviolacea TaxID=43657 RepID=A0A1C0TPB3_9GAMM|nr:Hint domain-containing protein [Pseudoalteromonas luteoviolacea]MBQ4811730.1 cell surface protein [Pseudoalteromonas luteoviolacea]OCQ20774.1 cell surface protein [Pseudoalteromonas luteoviolacea]